MFFLTICGDFRAFRRAVYAFLACTAVAFVVLPRDSTEFRFDKVRSTGRIGDLSLGGNQSPEGSEKGCSGGPTR
ncbi:glycosyltransferase 87 family protein [Embleya sp. NPDC020886]|uniref:glycosyltransferase 87 family protein n=1 Tax=Embleya sp. NPDC020886 TaxID=3363980 RepID=UPI0037A93583